MRIREVITEGLIQSVSREKLLSIIARHFPTATFPSWEGREAMVYVEWDQPWTVDYDKLQSILQRAGWFVANDDDGLVKLEPKYDTVAQDLPATMYHVTPKENVKKILAVGLSPRSNSRRSAHPDRCYLAFNKDDAVDLAQTFSKGDYFRPGDNKEYALLAIDTTKLNGVVFYDDLNFYRKGVYTTQNIPPSAITIAGGGL